MFDVACTLTDVIAYVPLDPTLNSQEQPTEYLNQFLNLISRLRGGASRYLPLLLAKVSENLPSMAAPIHHMPLSMIKQGYAGASDGIPTPMMPQDPSSWSSFGLQAPETFARSGHDQGLMFDTYSPSAHSGDTPITPLGTPQGFRGPPLAPIPRSIPIGPGRFDGYNG